MHIELDNRMSIEDLASVNVNLKENRKKQNENV